MMILFSLIVAGVETERHLNVKTQSLFWQHKSTIYKDPSPITIENVLIKGNHITSLNGSFTSNAVYAGDYYLNGSPIISTGKKANFKTLEIKNNQNDIVCLLNNLDDGVLEIDKISEITDGSGEQTTRPQLQRRHSLFSNHEVMEDNWDEDSDEGTPIINWLWIIKYLTRQLDI